MIEAALVQALADLARAATGEFAPETVLRELCTVAGAAMAVDGVGVMITEDGVNRFVHATTDAVAPLERIQQLLRTGPCGDAATSRRLVTVPDLTAVTQWPEFTSLAAELGIGSVAALPMVSRDRTWGVLDLYRFSPGPWSETERQAATMLADVAVSLLVMASDRDTARATQLQLAHRLLHDDLTGLPNRTLLFDRLDLALAAARRRNSAVAVLFIDLNGFKQINDTFGHAAGDAVLQTVSSNMHATLRGGDTLARLSGDEFVVLCQDLHDDPAGAAGRQLEAVTGRLKSALARPIDLGSVDVTVSASIGAAVAAVDGSSAQELLSEADAAMYRAKQEGHGTVVVRDHTLPGALTYSRQLERELSTALDHDQFAVHYQPIVTSTSPHRVAAVEALLRWHHPSGAVLPAAVFIDLAVSSGLMTALGRWVITQVCTQMRAWTDQLGDAAPATAYVNLSARELADVTLPDTLAAALERHHLHPAQIGLEITEDDLAVPELITRLSSYRERGHLLSIDDFGTGYSSLSRLVDLPVDFVKIDKSFVAGTPADTRRTGLIDAVLRIADSLALQVIAEGVETAEQQQHLKDADCHLLQGFYLGRPQPAADLTAAWLVPAQPQAQAAERVKGQAREPA